MGNLFEWKPGSGESVDIYVSWVLSNIATAKENAPDEMKEKLLRAQEALKNAIQQVFELNAQLVESLDISRKDIEEAGTAQGIAFREFVKKRLSDPESAGPAAAASELISRYSMGAMEISMMREMLNMGALLGGPLGVD